PASGTPPATAGVVDANVLAWLEECSVPCCGSFEAPAVAQKQGYRFGFNGMEKVDEMYGSTGNSYDFGARLYDPRVGRWLSLDPLVDDYPSISPYSYTNNNPILFIDPDGKKIVVYVNGEKHEYIPNTKPKSGSPDILFKLHEAISYNMKTEIGKSVWSALGETDKVVNIRFRDAVDYNDDRTNKFDPYMVNLRSDYTESLGTIFWDSDSKVMVFESKENGERGFATGYQSPSTVLLHEAGHAYIMLQALLTGVGGDEWKLYKEEGNDDLGQDKVYRNKEERKVVEEIEQPYIGQINAIEGINGSYQQSRSNSYGQVQFRDNQSNVNGGQTKVEQTNELNR
ncbi:MAG: RHS repeat-associated core domain-containing protein, partial [Flavobacteriales bacterium]